MTDQELTHIATYLRAEMADMVEKAVHNAMTRLENTKTFATKREAMDYLKVTDYRTFDRMVNRGDIKVLRNGHFQTDKIITP